MHDNPNCLSLFFAAASSVGLEGDRSVRRHVLNNLAENLERGEISGAGLALSCRQCDGYAVRHSISESATLTVGPSHCARW
jgi:hypothetical protein